MLQRTLPVHVVPAALKGVKEAQTHEDCLKALQHLHMLSSMQPVRASLTLPQRHTSSLPPAMPNSLNLRKQRDKRVDLRLVLVLSRRCVNLSRGSGLLVLAV